MFGVLSPLPALLDLVIAIATAAILLKLSGAPPSTGRFVSIDGLRGYLAFFVFMSHSSMWYFFLHGAHWTAPPSNLYTNFGQASVALFFMITGFLFYGKILTGRSREIDWSRLFLSRILRLYPLYLSVVLVLLVLVGIRSDWVLHESSISLAQGIMKWLGFTIAGSPDLNGVSQTSLMVAGVTWTLVYEWFFYLSLPIIALLSFTKTPVWALVFGLSGLVLLHLYTQLTPIIVAMFLGGILAALLVRIDAFRHFSKTRIASILVASCLLFEVTQFGSSYGKVPLIFLVVAFCLIASGNNLFGVLSHPISLVLGEISYGIYLIQGLVLFVYWKYIIGFDIASHAGPFTYWLLQSLCVPLLITVSYLAFRYIEKPAMNAVPSIHKVLLMRLKPEAGLAKEEI